MRVLFFSVLLLAGCAGTVDQPLETRIPVFHHVTPVSMPQKGAGQGSATPVLPASTAKLVTAAAIRETGNPALRFVTRLCRDGDAVSLIGGGDPAFDVEHLLALTLDARGGLKGVRRFYYAPSVTAGPVQADQPRTAAYNPVLADLMVAEGAYRGVRTKAGGVWSVPAGASPPATVGVDWYAHPNPPRQAADLMRDYAAGVGIALPAPQPTESLHCGRELARHASARLDELVRLMLWTSSNPMAELLGRSILETRDPSRWLQERNPSIQEFSLGNFSGLDAKARVTPQAMAEFLAHQADKDPGFPALLTPAGWDGGLKNRFQEPPLALSLWAKTGTMHYGVGLAGYLLVPGKGLHAISVYAFDEAARIRYDALVPHPDDAEEAAAKTWVDAARRAVDRRVLEVFHDLSG